MSFVRRAATRRPQCRFASAVTIFSTIGCLSGGWALAQVPPATHPVISPPSVTPTTTLEGYRRFESVDVAPWRGTNDTVRDVGGWRAYAREAQATLPAPAASARAPALAPASATDAPASTRPASPSRRAAGPAPHTGHGRH